MQREGHLMSSVSSINDQPISSAAAANISLRPGTSPTQFRAYLDRNGFNQQAQAFLKNKIAGDLDQAIDYAVAVVNYADSRPNNDERSGVLLSLLEKCLPENPEYLRIILDQAGSLGASRFCYRYFRDQGRENYLQLFRQQLGTVVQAESYFERLNAVDSNGDEVVSRNEAGYQEKYDHNRDGVIDLSEACRSLFQENGGSDPLRLFQLISPLRTLTMESLSAGKLTPAELARYQSVLQMAADPQNGFSAEVVTAAKWYQTELGAAQSINAGHLSEALAIYDVFARETGVEPGGDYARLNAQRGDLGFYEELFRRCQLVDPSVNGLSFIDESLGNGRLFEKGSFLISQVLTQRASAGPDEQAFFSRVESYLWQPNAPLGALPAQIELTPTSSVTLQVTRRPVTVMLGDRGVLAEITYDPGTRTWNVTVRGADVFSRSVSTQTEKLSLVFDVSRGRGVATSQSQIPLFLSGNVDQPVVQPATAADFYGRFQDTLASGDPLSVYYGVAPDKDAGVGFHTPGSFDEQPETGQLISRFSAHPEYVLDTSTTEGAARSVQIKTDLRGLSDTDAQAYLRQNLSPRELLRLLRLGDRFINGPVGPLATLHEQGYAITGIDYPEDGDPALLRIKTERRLDPDRLTGAARQAFNALPAEQRAIYQQTGISVAMTIEIFSTTDDASLAVGRHLAAKEENLVAFQSHAYHSGPRSRYMEENIVPEQSALGTTVGYLPIHCFSAQEMPFINGQFGSVFIPTGSYSQTTSDAYLVFRGLDAFLTGGDVNVSVREAFRQKAEDQYKGKAAYVYKPTQPSSAVAYSLHADSNNNGVPDQIEPAAAENTVLSFDPVRGELIIGGSVRIAPNNPYFNILGKTPGTIRTQFTRSTSG
jgi:hypothetical protein